MTAKIFLVFCENYKDESKLWISYVNLNKNIIFDEQ